MKGSLGSVGFSLHRVGQWGCGRLARVLTGAVTALSTRGESAQVQQVLYFRAKPAWISQQAGFPGNAHGGT